MITPSTHSVIPTRRIWNDDDDDGQMRLGDLGGLKLPDLCRTGDEKPRKNPTKETCPDRGSNPGPLHDRHACYRLLNSGGRHLFANVEKKIAQLASFFASIHFNWMITFESEPLFGNVLFSCCRYKFKVSV